MFDKALNYDAEEQDDKMRVLLLGGTGAMGTPIAKELSLKGYEVHITSRKQHTDNDNIKYLVGNAMDDEFVKGLLEKKYDVIVDFMIYTEEKLKKRIERFLKSCSQYVFLSSCRVYAPSHSLLTEESPRLLDVCDDEVYLKTNEYALAKAREENIIIKQKHNNWTIIRPSLTYNIGRLQLGSFEFHEWFSRVKNSKSIVFQHDLERIQVSMTHGDDVARAMALIIGNNKALGEVIQIASPENKSWKEILSIYLKALEEAGISYTVKWQDDSRTVSKILNREWRRKYATIVDRSFDSSKADRICGMKIEYTPMEIGLSKCLRETIINNNLLDVNIKLEAYLDRVSKERSVKTDCFKEWLKYFILRYTPYFKRIITDYSEV